MKRLTMMILLLLALAGCGDDTADTGAATEREVGDQPTTGATTSSARTNPKRSGPSGADAKRSLPFESAKELCEVIGVRGMADEYGGEPDTPITVAQAYAEDSIQPWARQDAIDGCMAGFE